MDATVQWLVALLLGALGSVLWYQWKRNDKRIDEMDKKLQVEVRRVYDKFGPEIEELRTNYRQQFGLVHANINLTKDAIIERISVLELSMVRNFVTKNDCRDVMKKHEDMVK